MLAAVLALLLTAGDDGAARWLTEPPGNHLLSAAEVTTYDLALFLNDRYLRNEDYAFVSGKTLRDNLTHPPRFDNDHIFVNFLGHPYQGAIPYGFARSTGLDFWTSSLYTFAADAGWEWLAEVQAPSINDLIESGPASSLWGEALFRISRLILAQRGGGTWGEAARALFAIAADPSATLNTALLGAGDEQWDVPFRARLYSGALGWQGGGAGWRPQALVGADLWYGLEDAPLAGCVKPFDRFELHASGAFGGTTTGDGTVRGLLAGCGYGPSGPPGAWGLFGSTDFGTGDGFRWSATSFGPGASAVFSVEQWKVRLQGTAEATLMGAAGSVAQTDYVEPNDTVPGTSRYSMGPGATLQLSAELSYFDRVWLRAQLQTWWLAALTPPGGGAERVDQLSVSFQLDLPARLFLGAELRAADRRAARAADGARAGWQARALAGVRLGE